MAILPTAHATQRFGSRGIDFYVAPGQVIGSDPRARADERRIQDLDGERHPVRIGGRDFALEAGDYAAVIRLQPGPKRRSRPVAVVNYRTQTWTRTSQDNTSLLSSAGVSRSANWMLTVFAMVALALLIAWPQLAGLAGLMAPGLAATLPEFDVFAFLTGAQPGLADARLESAAPGLASAIGAMAPALSGQENAVMFAGLVAAGTLIAFGARSWRFAWVPVFLVLLLAAAIAVDGAANAAIPALLALAGATLFFIVAGLINRWRDAARLEARIARLADHVLRHPPQEMVTRRETSPALSADDDASTGEAASDPEPAAPASPALAPLAAAAISARAGDETGSGTVEAVEDSETGETGDAAASDEQAAPDSDDDIPDLPAETGASGEAAPAEDVRSDARSMDIAPPPPMPVQGSGETAPQRVNRDAEETAGETLASITEADGPVVTETQILQPATPVEAGGIPGPQGTELAGQDGEASPQESLSEASSDDEDTQVSAGDAFTGGDEPSRQP